MPALGDPASSEQLIRDLYIDLRRRVNAWAAVTHQTAQARMGYIGQHLVSVATGYPGGRSGARGKDLVISAVDFGEIKTCYRVDQLGTCNACQAVVASIETQCHACGSADILRKEDSKWLVSFRNEAEYAEVLDPKWYFLVLFESDRNTASTIVASIWRVDPLRPGFAYAMVDYYGNIRAKAVASSKFPAPFNLWPYSLKFELMRPALIYRSRILSDDRIITDRFPGRDAAIEDQAPDWNEFSRSRNLTSDKLALAAKRLGLKIANGSKSHMIAALVEATRDAGLAHGPIADALAYALYRPDIDRFFSVLPQGLKSKMKAAALLS